MGKLYHSRLLVFGIMTVGLLAAGCKCSESCKSKQPTPLAANAPSLAAGSGATYGGYFFADTKGSASSSTPYVHPSNVVEIATDLIGKEVEALGTELTGREEAMRTYVDESIHGPAAVLTQAQINKNIGFNGSGYDENGPVEIGPYAKAALDTNDVAAVTAANTKLRNAGIAIGARAVAEGANKTKNQSIAIGLAAHAKGSSMIAIGPGSIDTNETVHTGNSTYAEGSASTAIGYSAKAFGNYALAIGSGESGTGKPATLASNNYTVAVGPSAQAVATGAVQIGKGRNTTPNSLQFQDVPIIRDGKFVGIPENTVTIPKEVDPSTLSPMGGDILVNPGETLTLLPTNSFNEGSELGLDAAGSRNYAIYLPNEEEVKAGMPIWTESEVPNAKTVFKSDNVLLRLPAKVTVTQPYSKLVIIESEIIDDDEDWSPVITNCNWVYNDNSSDPMLVLREGSKYAIEGYNLHAATNITVTYSGAGGSTTTVNVDTGSTTTSKKGLTFLGSTFFKGLRLNELKLPSVMSEGAGPGEYDIQIKYYTFNGETVFNTTL